MEQMSFFEVRGFSAAELAEKPGDAPASPVQGSDTESQEESAALPPPNAGDPVQADRPPPPPVVAARPPPEGPYVGHVAVAERLGPALLPAWWPEPPSGKARNDANQQALALAATIEKHDAHLLMTDEMRAILASYTGTGGIGTSLNEYYTPAGLGRAVWDVLARLGARAGRVLEPSAGIGTFMAMSPAGTRFVTVEASKESQLIQRVLFPPTVTAWANLAGLPLPEIEAAADRYVAGQDMQAEAAQAARSDFILGVQFGVAHRHNAHSASGAGWFTEVMGHQPMPYSVRASDGKQLYRRLKKAANEKEPGAALLLEALEENLRELTIDPRETAWGYGHDRGQIETRPGFHADEYGTVFEDYLVTSHRGSFDIVIGNPPFGVRGGTVRIDGRNIARAEEYFLRRGVQLLSPGGYLAMVVPSGFMETRRSRTMRRAVALDAEVVTAFRLPSSTFAAAGTGVATDVVILRRRDEGVARLLRVLGDTDCQRSGAVDTDFIEGRYFDAHPELVLGAPGPGWRERAGLGHDFEVAGSLEAAIARIDGWQPDARHNPLSVEVLRDRLTGAGMTAREWEDLVDQASWVKLDTLAAREEVPAIDDMDPSLRAAVEIGEVLGHLIEGDTTDREYVAGLVRDFVEEHGNPAGVPAVREWLRLSAAAPSDAGIRAVRRALNRLCAAVREDGTLSDAITGAGPGKVSFATAEDAISVLAAEPSSFGRAQVRGLLHDDSSVTDAGIDAALENAGGLEPCGRGEWMSAGAFYSGDLWARHNAIQDLLQGDGALPHRERHERQVGRLMDLIAPVPLEEVEIAINSPFVPVEVVDAFLHSAVARDGLRESIDLGRQLVLEDSLYKVVNARTGEHVTWSDSHLAVRVLNRHKVAASDADAVYMLNAAFTDWLLSSQHRGEVERQYNRTFRGWHVERSQFSNTPIAFAGMSGERALNDYHNATVRWAAQIGRGVSASDVGVGKTTEGIMTARHLVQKGEVRNPLFVVPKYVAAKWCREIRGWFPDANLLLIGETTRQGKGGTARTTSDSADVCRQKFHRLAQNSFDFVIVTEEAWNRLDTAPESKWRLMQEDFDIRRGEALGNRGSKAVQKAREQYAQYTASRDFERRDDTIYVTDLGISFIAIDEIHRYKNLYAPRSRYGQSPKFLGGSGESIRAFDTYIKLKALRRDNPDLRVLGLSATPSPNSPLEIYAIMSLVDPAPLRAAGIESPEHFLDRFVNFEMKPTLDLDGNVETALVTTGFKNLGELRRLMDRCFRRTTAADVGLRIPEERVDRSVVAMTPAQRAFFQDLRDQVADESSDVHVFSVLASMAKASIDPGLVLPEGSNEPSPKIDSLVEHVMTHYRDDHGKHLVFCDHIDVHGKIRDLLVGAGVPAAEIAIVNAQTAPTSEHRLRISEKFNSGEHRIAIGNTATMGEGQDFQRDTQFIHHLDFPWGPDPLRQRNGRGIRQGNDRESVTSILYFLAGSNDAYRYETIMAKKEWKDVLWSDAETAENPCLIGMPDRREMIIMLSEDPAAARAAFEADDEKNTQARQAVGRRVFNRDAALLWSMTKNLAALGSMEAGSVNVRLEQRIASMRQNILQTPWLDDEARRAISAGEPMAIIEATGETVTPAVVMEGAITRFQEGVFILRGVDRDKDGGINLLMGEFGRLGGMESDVPADRLPDDVTIKEPSVTESAAIRAALEAPRRPYQSPIIATLAAAATLPPEIWRPHVGRIAADIAEAKDTSIFPVRTEQGALVLMDSRQIKAAAGMAGRVVIPVPDTEEEILKAAVAAWQGSEVGTARQGWEAYGLISPEGIEITATQCSRIPLALADWFGTGSVVRYQQMAELALLGSIEEASDPLAIIEAGVRYGTFRAKVFADHANFPVEAAAAVLKRMTALGVLDDPVCPAGEGQDQGRKQRISTLSRCVLARRVRPPGSAGQPLRIERLPADTTGRQWLRHVAKGIVDETAAARPCAYPSAAA